MNTNQEVITPEIAKHYLTKNKTNRQVRRWWVNDLKNAMDADKFYLSHQGIAFNLSGDLVDGQHRLLAVLSHGKPITMLVSRAVSENVFGITDCGVKRSLADRTNLDQRCAEACRLLAKYYNLNRNTISAEEAISIADIGVGEIHNKLMEYAPTKRLIISSAPVRVGAILSIMNGEDEQYVKELYFNLIHSNFLRLPSIGHIFIKQVHENKLNNKTPLDLLARSLKLFKQSNWDKPSLRVSDEEIAALQSTIRSIIHTYKVNHGIS